MDLIIKVNIWKTVTRRRVPVRRYCLLAIIIHHRWEECVQLSSVIPLYLITTQLCPNLFSLNGLIWQASVFDFSCHWNRVCFTIIEMKVAVKFSSIYGYLTLIIVFKLHFTEPVHNICQDYHGLYIGRWFTSFSQGQL